jgi:predicted dehydrogenase
MVRRFAPTACWLKQLAADLLDPWKRLEWSEGGPFRWPVSHLDYFRPSAGNGLLWDIGAHVIDLLVWWLGEPVELRCWDDAMGGIEANARLELRFDGGCQATVRLSRDTPIAQRILIGRRADELRIADAIDGPVEWRRREAPLALQGTVGPTAQARSSPGLADRADFAGCFVAQLKNVLGAVRGVDRPWVQAADVLAGLRTLERAVAESQLLELPWLSENERGEALRLRAVRTPMVVES